MATPQFVIRLQKFFYLPGEICDMFGISQPTLYKWTRKKEMKFPQPKKVGGRLFFRKTEIDRFYKKLFHDLECIEVHDEKD